MDERELPVIQSPGEGLPHALVFAGVPHRPLTPAEAKKARYAQNLKENLRKFEEAMSCVEWLAGVCELPQARVDAIRKAKDEALAELSRLFEEKLKTYDARISGDAP